jgi:hypothetical protein
VRHRPIFFPELTAEQIVGVVNAIAAAWLRRRRGERDPTFIARRTCYHQRRNRAAKRSRGVLPRRE